jgi:hypothetical protein
MVGVGNLGRIVFFVVLLHELLHELQFWRYAKQQFVQLDVALRKQRG